MTCKHPFSNVASTIGIQTVSIKYGSVSGQHTPASWCQGVGARCDFAFGKTARICWIGLQIISEPTKDSAMSRIFGFLRKLNVASPRACIISKFAVTSGASFARWSNRSVNGLSACVSVTFPSACNFSARSAIVPSYSAITGPRSFSSSTSSSSRYPLS